MQIHHMAGHVIRRLNQSSTHVFAQKMQAEGISLTPVQFAAMDAILKQPGIDQAGLAACIAYDKATIGGVVDRLVQKTYVQRHVSRKDRRARELRLTDQGTALLEACLPVVIALQKDILSGLNDAEIDQFLALAAKALAAHDNEGDGKLKEKSESGPAIDKLRV